MKIYVCTYVCSKYVCSVSSDMASYDMKGGRWQVAGGEQEQDYLGTYLGGSPLTYVSTYLGTWPNIIPTYLSFKLLRSRSLLAMPYMHIQRMDRIIWSCIRK